MNRPPWLLKLILGKHLYFHMRDVSNDVHANMCNVSSLLNWYQAIQDEIKQLKLAHLSVTRDIIDVVTENDNLRAGISGLLGHINILKKELKNALHKRQQRKTKKRSN